MDYHGNIVKNGGTGGSLSGISNLGIIYPQLLPRDTGASF